MSKTIDAIKGIIIVNIIFYLITFLMPGMKELMFNLFALYFPENETFKFWQVVSNMFMHGSFGHILFNMYALWAFGTPLEKIWGQKKFLVFYFLCGIGAAVIYTGVNYIQYNSLYNELVNAGLSKVEIQNLLDTGQYKSNLTSVAKETLEEFYRLFHTPAVGASGAIYGVLVAFGILFPDAKLALLFFPVPIKAKYFIPGLILLDFFSGITGFSIFGGGIAHFAHIGGAAIGFLLMWYWRQKGYKRYTYYQ